MAFHFIASNFTMSLLSLWPFKIYIIEISDPFQTYINWKMLKSFYLETSFEASKNMKNPIKKLFILNNIKKFDY